MSSVFTTTSDKALELKIRGQNFARELFGRLAEERGQTASEYLGVLVVISVIIAALVTTGVGDEIKGFISDTVRDISGGDSSAD